MPIPTDVIPLGTASAHPARERHLPALAVRREGETLLFDCGEGTQMRLARAGLKRTRLEAVFVTHFHGDHLYGLFGLLTTLALLERSDPLAVVGPEGIEEIARGVPGLQNDWLPYEIEFVELDEDFSRQIVLDRPDYRVVARPLDHRVFCIGYRFEEKARPGHLDVERANALGVSDYKDYRLLKAGEAVTTEEGRRVEPDEVVGPERPGVSVAYVTDTAPCEAGRALADGADLLYHEATFLDEMRERAAETGHATARQAAEVAAGAGAERLLLGHFSARYDDSAVLAREARRVFENTEAAEELKRYRLVPDAPG